MNVLMTSLAYDKRFTASCCHSFHPGWFFFLSRMIQISQLADGCQQRLKIDTFFEESGVNP